MARIQRRKSMSPSRHKPAISTGAPEETVAPVWAQGGDVLTTVGGVPVDDTMLMDDFHLREKIMHFDHERIPGRAAHARGGVANRGIGPTGIGAGMELVGPKGRTAGPVNASSTESLRFGIVMPVHDEEELAPAALASLDRAIAFTSDRSVIIGIAVVLDSCSDRSNELVAEWRHRTIQRDDDCPIEIVETDVGSVGHARRMGCEVLLHAWSDVAPEAIWLATTDADSEVPLDWISRQLRIRREDGQVWVGTVEIRDWSGRSAGTAEAWRRQYDTENIPIHGANFGIDGETYLMAGGFAELPTGEDRDLFERAVALGAVVRRDPQVRVVTSGRREARAPRGFAHALTSIESMIARTTGADQPELTAS
jgi:hypothetical protein